AAQLMEVESFSTSSVPTGAERRVAPGSSATEWTTRSADRLQRSGSLVTTTSVLVLRMSSVPALAGSHLRSWSGLGRGSGRADAGRGRRHGWGSQEGLRHLRPTDQVAA